MKLSIVIPAYNEEHRLPINIVNIIEYIEKKIEYEIIIVDDGSKSPLKEWMAGSNIKILRNDINRGKGYSVKKGVLASTGDYILYTDADLSTPIEELDKLWKYKDEYDIVIGSRRMPESRVITKQSPLRILAGKVYPFFVKSLIMNDIQDTQCGFKLFKSKCTMLFAIQKINGFSFDVEILYLAKKYHFKIKEIGVEWYNNKNSKLNMLKDIPIMLKELLMIKIYHKNGPTRHS